MLILLLLALCTKDVLTITSSDILDLDPYLVMFPNSLIAGVPLGIRVTILNSTASVDVQAQLLDGNQNIVVSNSRTMSTGETSHIQLQIPIELKNTGSYAVRVSGSGGLLFDTAAYIRQEPKGIHVITQTDKTRYSAGQDVKFRSVLLLPNLLGYKGNATVTVYDGKSNKIQVIGPRMTTDGVLEGMLSLSKEPVFGVWRLVTTAQGISATKTFTVKPYVLPRFSVSIAISGQNDTTIEVNVTARYTFNSKVHGKCKVQIYMVGSTNPAAILEYEQEIQGSVVFHIRTRAITNAFGTYHDAINIRALVTDAASAVTMVAEKYNFVPEHLYKSGDFVHIERFDNRQTFVPGMNFYTTLLAKKKQAEVHAQMRIGVTVRITKAEVKTCKLSHPPYQWLETTRIDLPMIYVDTDDTGLAPLNIPTPHNAKQIQITVMSEMSGENDKFTIYPLVWDTTPMLRLVPSKPHVKVGEDIMLAVNASERMSGKLTLEVYARGIALSVSSVDVSAEMTSTVSVAATADMVPHAHLVVTHITGNNSFMYDYAVVQVLGSPIKNQVSVGFNTTTLEPGKDVELTVSADPNSTVYVLSEDQRNRLLGSDNDVNLYQIDAVVSETGYNVSSVGDQRAPGSKRSLHIPTLRDDYYQTGYSFVDDGIIVLPENNHILSRVSSNELSWRDGNYPDQSNRMYATTTLGLCRDNIDTCSQYPISVCWNYRVWASSNCVRYCALCCGTFPPQFTTTAGLFRPTVLPTILGLSTTVPPATPHAAAPELRNYFPETWIWEQFKVGPSGKFSLPLTVPDSITSWVTSVFATNEKSGFGLDTTKPKITVKKDFFVTMDPPKVIVLGEEFLLQLTVFNYLDTVQQVLVQVNTTDDPGKVLESTLNVNPGDGHSTFFQITPKHVGDMKITALAHAGFFSNRAVDELVKGVTVKPNGVHKSSNEQHLVDISTNTFNQRFILADPPNMVPGSKSIKMSITGDFMTNTIEGLDQLISMPYGCGEQTMLNFAPDIYITKYLMAVGKLTAKIQKKTMKILKSGLQRELSYKHIDSSFSAFGDRDPSGSSWLTAFVLKCFQQAEGVLDIDESIKATGVNWLLNYQRSDGSFYEPGRIIHTQMQAGTGSGLKLTAFILISILENSVHAKSLKLTTSVSNASAYLEKNLAHVTDMYTLAIVCYALAKSGSHDCFNKLETAAVHDGDKMYWTAHTQIHMMAPVSKRRASKTRAPSADIEATSYCLLTYLTVGQRLKAKPIVKWLVSQRNPRGGFQSTQDTVSSLQALSGYAAFLHGSSQVNFSANGGAYAHAYSVTKANSDLLHVVEVPETLSDLMVTATGKGNAVVDVTMSYYVNGIENNNQIAVNSTILKESLNSISVRACVQWNGVETSGMIVAEVEMPTGFSYDVDLLNRDRIVKKHELIGQNVALYFDGIRAGSQVCPTVKMDRTDPVVKSQACHVTVYDYYEPTNQARTRYESGILKSSTICDVCPECSFCKGGSSIGQIGVGK